LVTNHAGSVGGLACHEGAAGGYAGGTGCIPSGKHGAFAGEAVEVGGFGDGVVEAAEAVTAEVIGDDEDDVWAVGHGGVLVCGFWRSGIEKI
jgi:hypothetical protein